MTCMDTTSPSNHAWKTDNLTQSTNLGAAQNRSLDQVAAVLKRYTLNSI